MYEVLLKILLLIALLFGFIRSLLIVVLSIQNHHRRATEAPQPRPFLPPTPKTGDDLLHSIGDVGYTAPIVILVLLWPSPVDRLESLGTCGRLLHYLYLALLFAFSSLAFGFVFIVPLHRDNYNLRHIFRDTRRSSRLSSIWRTHWARITRLLTPG